MKRPTPMKIAVASGKGGTGKTTVATSLVLSRTGRPPCLADCDVEAPNAHLFFKLTKTLQETIHKPIPAVIADACTYCGKCAEVCEFHAISIFNRPILAQQSVMILPNLCHSCGACSYICPEKAIIEQPTPIGRLQTYQTAEGVMIVSGEMQIGTAMPVPVIKAVQKEIHRHQEGCEAIIYDAPPGNSCSVVETMKQSDFVVLVTEPTPFGLHDLKLIIKLTQQLGKPTGIVINRDGIGNDAVENFAQQNNIPIILKIPYSPETARQLAQGKPLIKQSGDWQPKFEQVFRHITQELNK